MRWPLRSSRSSYPRLAGRPSWRSVRTTWRAAASGSSRCSPCSRWTTWCCSTTEENICFIAVCFSDFEVTIDNLSTKAVNIHGGTKYSRNLITCIKVAEDELLDPPRRCNIDMALRAGRICPTTLDTLVLSNQSVCT